SFQPVRSLPLKSGLSDRGRYLTFRRISLLFAGTLYTCGLSQGGVVDSPIADCLTNSVLAVSVSPNMLFPPMGASINLGDSLPSQRVSMLTPAAGVHRKVAEVWATVSSSPPKIQLPSSILLVPVIRQPNVVSPSNRRIQPSAISLEVKVFGFGSSAWT